MATLLKVLNNLADIKSAGGVALGLGTQARLMWTKYFLLSLCGSLSTSFAGQTHSLLSRRVSIWHWLISDALPRTPEVRDQAHARAPQAPLSLKINSLACYEKFAREPEKFAREPDRQARIVDAICEALKNIRRAGNSPAATDVPSAVSLWCSQRGRRLCREATGHENSSIDTL